MSLADSFDDANRLGFDFLIADIRLAITMMEIAQQAGADHEKRQRNLENAKRAYETVHRLMPRLSLSPEQMQELSNNFEHLQAELKRLENEG